IIMAQQQHAADVHPDELCPSNKRYGIVLAYFEGRRIKVSAQVYAGQEGTHSYTR
ncbi:hypothetical protein Tco_1581591, partial [Tanacetum coccineum]